MPTHTRLILFALAGLALLTSCDPRNEEEASFPPAQDLSASELIEQVLQTEKSITSVREHRTDVSTQVAVPLGEADNAPQEEKTVRITVGEDSYTKYESVDTDFCEGDLECVDFPGFSDETLWYNGKRYVRSEAEWVVESESGCLTGNGGFTCYGDAIGHIVAFEDTVGTGGFTDCPALESIQPIEPSRVYSFEFSWLTSPERVASGSDDSDLIHIKGVIDKPFWSLGLTPEMEAIYAECGIDPAEQFNLDDIPPPMRDYFPDRFKGEADIWIDPATFYVHRLEYRLDSLNGDRLIATNVIKAEYSLFNRAELPGPLPE